MGPNLRQSANIYKMYFSRKIYYNNKPLILTTDSKTYKHGNSIADGYLMLTGAFRRNYRLAIAHLEKITALGVIIEDESQKALMAGLEEIYEPIEAGGGVVFNEDGNVLMIYRRGKWDLPKGKKDDGEEIDYCALREVSEETGLQHLILGEKIGDTYHIYAQNKKNLLKHTTWFKMFGTSNEKLHPQIEENILEARWVTQKNMASILLKSFEAVKEVLEEAGVKW